MNPKPKLFFTICNFALFVEQSLKYYCILATSSEARNRSCNVLVLRARVQLFDEEWVHRTRSTRKGAFFRPFWFEITSHPLGAVDCQLHREKAFRLPVPDAFHTSTLWRTSSAPARVLLPMVALPQSSRRNDQNKVTRHPLLACLTCLFTLRLLVSRVFKVSKPVPIFLEPWRQIVFQLSIFSHPCRAYVRSKAFTIH